jgi:hypothetical protein
MPVTMRLLRTAIAVLAAAAVLLAGAWAGGSCAPARAQAGSAPRVLTAGGFPQARETEQIPVGDALAVNGHPLRLSVFYTTDAPDQVIAFYAEAFRARGLLPIAAADRHLAHVSVLDPADGLQRGVTALFERSGHTLVLLAVSDPQHVPRLIERAPAAPYPVPAEHRAFLGYSSEDGSARAHSGQFVSSLATPHLVQFYRERLGAQGYAERTEHPGQGLLVFTRKSGTVSIALQALGDGGGSAVFVNQVDGSP